MKQIKKVVIVGGGSAGWMSASMMSKLLKDIDITLIESEQIGGIGVGEASIPPLTVFNQVLGINEAEFMKETQASIKLGIQFENWNQHGDSYMHAFGNLGKDLGLTPFHHFWLRSKQSPETFWDYSFNYQAAKHGKYNLVEKIPDSQLKGLTHAYHFDAALYAKYLKKFAITLGVKHKEGLVEQVIVNKESGHIESINMQDGSRIFGDFFIDCSGMNALLIEKALGTGFEDWSQYLPCDRALAVPSKRLEQTLPYTRSIGHDAGWQWQIPLQRRIGNGLVYSSRFMSDEEAKNLLLANLPSEATLEPKLITFRVGRRLKQWNKNCVALGLSSGFLEPLESTSIHLIQSGITRLVKMFPQTTAFETIQREFNSISEIEFNHIRDFIILHYRLNRKDLPFWRYCRLMDIPDSLKHKIKLFQESAHVSSNADDLFTETAWQQVMIGQGIIPETYHPLANGISEQQLNNFLKDLTDIFDSCAEALPEHDDFLQHYCPAN